MAYYSSKARQPRRVMERKSRVNKQSSPRIWGISDGFPLGPHPSDFYNPASSIYTHTALEPFISLCIISRVIFCFVHLSSLVHSGDYWTNLASE